ncbi:MAG TPA: hypothetical protein VJ623_11675 [Holophagaceae bacterium]|nr:hypothetical protein [Holophagaceae bacterium]
MDPRVDPAPDLRDALAVLLVGGLLGWGFGRSWTAALIFLAQGLLAVGSVAFLVWRVKRGPKAASALVGLGNLALLGFVARAIMERFPGENYALLSGMLLHIPALFWAAFRVWWKQARNPS